METLNLLAAISSIASFLLGLVGLVTVWPAIVNMRIEAKAWTLYVALREEAGIDIYSKVWNFKPGTKEFQLAEYLVDQGKLFRRAMGSYGVWVSDLERGNNPS
jgi:hypothetical protein